MDEQKKPDEKDDESPQPMPPGGPERTPVQEPDGKEAPMGDPQPEKNKPRL